MFKNILVPLDGSPLAEEAIPLALHLAREEDAQVLLFQVRTDPTAQTCLAEYQHLDELLQEFERISEAYLAPLAARLCAEGARVSYEHVHDSRAVRAILQRAAALPQALIVMTSHGRTGLSRYLLGSIAEQVTRHAPCPVLLKRHEEQPAA